MSDGIVFALQRWGIWNKNRTCVAEARKAQKAGRVDKRNRWKG